MRRYFARIRVMSAGRSVVVSVASSVAEGVGFIVGNELMSSTSWSMLFSVLRRDALVSPYAVYRMNQLT